MHEVREQDESIENGREKGIELQKGKGTRQDRDKPYGKATAKIFVDLILFQGVAPETGGRTCSYTPPRSSQPTRNGDPSAAINDAAQASPRT